MLYRFITEDDTARFCQRVSEALANGWVLHGSPSYAHDAQEGVMRCGQAVIKEGIDYEQGMKLGEQ